MKALRDATFTRPDGRQVWGLTAAARPPLFEWSPLLWAQAGPIFLNPTETAPGALAGLRLAPGLADALGEIAELRRLGVVPPSFGIDDQPAARDQFLSGRAAFMMTSPGFIPSVAAQGLPYVILAPPVGAWGRPITTGALGCFAVVDHPDDPERTRASHRLARYLTSAEVVEDVPDWYLAPPVRRSIPTFEADPAYAGLMTIVQTAVYMNAPGGGAFIEGAVIPRLQAALMGLTPPERAVREIMEAHERRSLAR
jgi:multiple sugar transport system substrate-binding protein